MRGSCRGHECWDLGQWPEPGKTLTKSGSERAPPVSRHPRLLVARHPGVWRHRGGLVRKHEGSGAKAPCRALSEAFAARARSAFGSQEADSRGFAALFFSRTSELIRRATVTMPEYVGFADPDGHQ